MCLRQPVKHGIKSFLARSTPVDGVPYGEWAFVPGGELGGIRPGSLEEGESWRKDGDGVCVCVCACVCEL